jgi:conjugal transfer pilus assembly protein TraD
MSPAPERRWRPYWVLVIIPLLLISPPAWVSVAAIAGAAGATLLAARVLPDRPGPAPEPGGDGVLLGSEGDGMAGERRPGRPVFLTDRQLSAHALILGASGAGKSTTLLRILTDSIRRGLPVVAIDLKGSPGFVRALGDAAAAAGREFALWTPDGPAHWNPLAHGNATELKDKLIATERFTEPHYQRAAERYVQTVLQVLLERGSGAPPTLAEVVGLMDPRRLAAGLRAAPRPLARRVQDYVATLSPDQLSAIRGLGTRLAIISESHTGAYLGPGGGRPVDLRAALAGDQVVAFSLNSSTYGKLAAQLGTLVIQDLVAAVGHRLQTPSGPRALIAIDEFSALGSDNTIALLARGREAGASVLLATQELADLDRAARGLRDQVLGNTAVKIAHRQDVPASAQAIAQMAGTETVWDHTHRIARRPLLGAHDTGAGTRRQVERFVIHPNVIKTLPTGEAVLITKLPRAQARTVRVLPPPARGPIARPPPARGGGIERE